MKVYFDHEKLEEYQIGIKFVSYAHGILEGFRG